MKEPCTRQVPRATALECVLDHSLSKGQMRSVMFEIAFQVGLRRRPWETNLDIGEFAKHTNMDKQAVRECVRGLAGFGPRALETPEIEFVPVARVRITL